MLRIIYIYICLYIYIYLYKYLYDAALLSLPEARNQVMDWCSSFRHLASILQLK